MRPQYKHIGYKSCIAIASAACLNIGSSQAITVQAQTLSGDGQTDTTVTTNTITEQFVVDALRGGTIRGNSLFHSFEEFSPEDWSVVFDLSGSSYSSIDFIIGRVTGGDRSSINGELSTLGGHQPNLMLINPAGITFGPEATLDQDSIGSFFASTAESVLFDQDAFSAINPTTVPALLSVSVPTGLQMGRQSGNIMHTGPGHSLSVVSDPRLSPYQPTALPTGLSVESGRTLGIVANGIDLTGATLTASGGHINLLSLNDGQVSLTQPENQPSALTLGLTNEITPPQSSDINLAARSLLDVSGSITGNVYLQGQDINLTDGAVVWAQNRGPLPSGDIVIDASQSLTLSGQLTQGQIVSSIVTETLAPGEAGDLIINAPQFSVLEGSALGSRTADLGIGAPRSGNSGDISITTTHMTLEGYAAAESSIFSRVGTYTVSDGDAGSLTLNNAETLTIREGGSLGSTTLFKQGRGGDVFITAQDIEVSGTTPTGELSLILAAAGAGDAGNLTLVTDRLRVTDSGEILTSSFDGSSGNIDITATDSVRVTGRRANNRESSITSGVFFSTPAYRQLVSNPNPTGDAGQVTISTQTLRVDDGGTVTVANVGPGLSGSLSVSAREIILNDGEISATTASGRGGDIELQSSQVLVARQGSRIQATSFGTGDGGNIDINSPFIIGQENSDIVANAVIGKGGNIQITTEGIFGFQFRNAQTEQSDITASSEFGVEGTVAIETTGTDVSASLAVLDTAFSDTDQQVVAGCSTSEDNQFVVSGRSGIASNPFNLMTSDSIWLDFRLISDQSERSLTNAEQPVRITDTDTRPTRSTLSEASRWQRNEQQQIELVADTFTQVLSIAECLEKNAPNRVS